MFRILPPSKDVLAHLVTEYESITGDKVRTDRPNKRNLIATCYRIHADDFLPFVADYFRVEGSYQNLLGVIRWSEPRIPGGDADTYYAELSARDSVR